MTKKCYPRIKLTPFTYFEFRETRKGKKFVITSDITSSLHPYFNSKMIEESLVMKLSEKLL